jgi:hypothetical protein
MLPQGWKHGTREGFPASLALAYPARGISPIEHQVVEGHGAGGGAGADTFRRDLARHGRDATSTDQTSTMSWTTVSGTKLPTAAK